MKITFFAHGTTTDNQDKRSSGWNDVELSELGIQQSKDLGPLTEHIKFDAIYTSDLVRAVDSARLSWGDSYPTHQDDRLRECNYGDLNGEKSEIVEPVQEKSIDTPMPNGESYENVKTRMQAFLDDLAKTDYEHVGIVGHKATQFCLEVILKNKTWEEVFEEDWRPRKAWQPGWEYTL